MPLAVTSVPCRHIQTHWSCHPSFYALFRNCAIVRTRSWVPLSGVQTNVWLHPFDNLIVKIPRNFTYLPTYSMVLSPSWEANWSTASQEIPRISRNPKVHYRTHKRPPPVSILGLLNPVHIHTSHFLEIHPNIIHPSTPRSTQWSASLRFPHQDPVHPPLVTHTRHMPRGMSLANINCKHSERMSKLNYWYISCVRFVMFCLPFAV